VRLAPSDRLGGGVEQTADPGQDLRRQAAAQEIQAGLDTGQQVVEIVGDAAGELAHGFHLLSLAQQLLGLGATVHLLAQLAIALLQFGGPRLHLDLQGGTLAAQGLFGLAAVIDVFAGAVPADHGARFIAPRIGAGAQPAVAAIRHPYPVFLVVGPTGAARRIPGLPGRLAVVRMQQRPEGIGVQRRLAGQLLPARRKDHPPAVGIAGPGVLGIELHQMPIVVFAFAQLQIRLVALDGQGGGLGDQAKGVALGGQGAPWLQIVIGEGAQQPAIQGQQRHRPAGPQAVAQRQVTGARPQRIAGDVLDIDGFAPVGGGATGACQRTDLQPPEIAAVGFR